MMTKTITFDASKFLAAARAARKDVQEFFALHGGKSSIQTIRDAYRYMLDESDFGIVSYVETPRTAADLDAELSTAAGAAGQAGASRAQIDAIIVLCTEQNDFARMGYSRLTYKQAAGLLNDLRR